MERIFLSLSCCLVVSAANAQCVADAGEDQHLCGNLFGGFDTVALGGDPVVTGGTAPYTFSWSARLDMGWGGWVYWASDMLNDTSLAHPSLVQPMEEMWYILTVTDAEGNTCTDSVFVGLSLFGFIMENMPVNIVQGDSFQFFAGSNVEGSRPPFSYVWHPNESLSDSTSLTAWASPTESTDYYLTITDPMGCSVDGAPYYLVNVTPLGTGAEAGSGSSLNAFPSPADRQFTVVPGRSFTSGAELRVLDMNGRVLERSSATRGTRVIHCGHWSSGIYTVEVLGAKGVEGRCRILVE